MTKIRSALFRVADPDSDHTRTRRNWGATATGVTQPDWCAAKLRKAEIELSAGTPAEIAAINARFPAMRTRGDARSHAELVRQKVAIAREQRLAQQRKR